MELKFSENLKKLIDSTGKDIKFLAGEIGVNYITLYNYSLIYEKRENINFVNVVKICKYFNISMDELLLSKESENAENIKKLKELVKSISI